MGHDAVALPTPKISPSMLSSDFANLASEAKFMEDCGADWLHMDIMLFYSENSKVKRFNILPRESKFLKLVRLLKAFLDCHLMVTNPADYVMPFAKAGASSFTFHAEVTKDSWPELIKSIKSSGMQAGVAIKPGTPIEDIFPLVEGEDSVDMVLVMTVEPGFGGQSFMPDMMPKVKELRRRYPNLDIQVDGGLAPSTIDQAAAAGANVIVAGSAVFGAKDPAGVIKILRNSIERAQSSKIFFQ
ncbi:hypothetical protein AXG93_3964s1060 [Marchantia polymorpha subsp. ruderalis]|uniref:ribulose-phosphate 3-epimerase n=1 Tax=Marchantia polymorpha subsp. ruderalis TaxID=1480154 RepID=A0A176WCC3_MARPO|nr:hypothetical protein AXG93_3964s1060 [Marchantia polymorpha subsp. ruderalis]